MVKVVFGFLATELSEHLVRSNLRSSLLRADVDQPERKDLLGVCS